LKAAISEWAKHYNNVRYHESLDNVTPIEIFYGRYKVIMEKGYSLNKIPVSQEGEESAICVNN